MARNTEMKVPLAPYDGRGTETSSERVSRQAGTSVWSPAISCRASHDAAHAARSSAFTEPTFPSSLHHRFRRVPTGNGSPETSGMARTSTRQTTPPTAATMPPCPVPALF